MKVVFFYLPSFRTWDAGRGNGKDIRGFGDGSAEAMAGNWRFGEERARKAGGKGVRGRVFLCRVGVSDLSLIVCVEVAVVQPHPIFYSLGAFLCLVYLMAVPFLLKW